MRSLLPVAARALACICLVTLGAAPAFAAPQLLTVEELNQSSARYIGVEIRVEGRVLVASKTALKFRNCEMSFHAESGLPEIDAKSPNLEVTGKITREEGRYVFLVSQVREVPTDLDQFQEQRNRIRNDAPSDWYRLAAWAEKRGTFYKDYELLSKSADAKKQGVLLERRQASEEGPDALFQLAAKVKTLELPARLSTSLVHEACLLRVQSSGTLSIEKKEALAAELARDLPGCKVPLNDPELGLRKSYEVRPVEVYDAADEVTRRKLNRILYASLVLSTLTPKLAPDGSNGFDVAELIDRRTPEYKELAETYRDRALAFRAAEVGKMPRKEVLALADQYRARQQPRQAEDVVETWLTLRRRKLEPDDTEGILQLSEEYRQLLKRDDMADRMLLEAHRNNPRAADIAERLDRLGFVQKEGVWMTKADFEARPEGELERALRQGNITAGMSGIQVRQSMGEPTGISRSASADAISEIWTYNQADSTQLAIRLVKRRRQPDLKVVDISQVRAASFPPQ